MISINDLTVSFGGFNLFEEVSFHINDNDRIGLVGRNGSGKTTLLKIVAGITHPSSGVVQIPSALSIGYLPQEMEYSRESTVFDEAMKAFSHIARVHQQIDEINAILCERTDYESESYHKLIVNLNDLTERLNVLGNGNPEADAEKVLVGLGFKREEFGRKRAVLSQGMEYAD